jgi:predicted membrane-bound dolichyl-phosphate-mannose-protein mannosyltransferase
VAAGGFSDACGVVRDGAAVPVRVVPTVIATADGGAIAGGIGADGAALVRVQDAKQSWSVALPARPVSLAVLGADSFVVAENGALLRVAADGTSKSIAQGTTRVASAKDDLIVWASFADAHKVVAYGQDGGERFSVDVPGRPQAIAVSTDADRVLAADGSARRIEAVDTESHTRSDELAGVSPALFGQVSETGLVWAASGRHLRVIEPRGFAVIGQTTLPGAPLTLLNDRLHGRLVAVTEDGLACVSGRNTFAWRFGSAIFGAAMVALVVLIVLRLFGSMPTAALAGLFLIVDGLAFVMARIAMNDSYVTAFILGAWFAALSAIYHRRPNDDGSSRRGAAIAWFVATGAFLGLGLASKWVALYACAGVVLLFAWDLRARGRDGIAGLAGHPLATLALSGVVLGAIPVGIYVASYVPYFHLHHGFADLVRLQKGMYDYHAHLKATHPYGSPWYGWPVGHKAVWLYLGTHGANRAEIWTVANPIVFIGGLVGLVTLASAAWRRRAAAAAVPVAAALTQYLPWITVTRVTFLYHYLPCVPFLSIGLAWWLTIGRKGARRRNLEIVTVAAAAVLAFAFILPLVDDWFVSPSYQQAVKAWLSWMF